MEKININHITTANFPYPLELITFFIINNIKIPRITSGRGKALSAMANNPNKYWDRNSCNEFCKKFNIKTKDSIQLFNKMSQLGLKTGDEVGKNYIIYPYEISNKYNMRKNFNFNGTITEANATINNIKDNIRCNYLEVSNTKWQAGHKNPDSSDNSTDNFIYQPPIQAKYRDNYIFLDALTKIPTPRKFIKLYNSGKCPYTTNQLLDLKKWLNSITL